MVKCKSCGKYIEQGSKFCGYCGTRIWCTAEEVAFTYEDEIEVQWENYKSQGVEKRRIAFFKQEQYKENIKIGTFVPDFVADIEAAWLIDDERILMLTQAQDVIKLRETKVNKKSSKEICTLLQNKEADFPKSGYELCSISETEFLLTVQTESDYNNQCIGVWIYRICKNEVVEYPKVSIEDRFYITGFYKDGTILANADKYLIKPDGTAKKAADFYNQKELLNRYYKRCKKEDQYTYPNIFWERPYIQEESIDLENQRIYVTIICGDRHEETLLIGMDGTLPIEDKNVMVLSSSEWQKEKEDIIYLQKLARKDEPDRKLRQNLVAFERFEYNSKSFLYGTAETEQFLYVSQTRELCFFPPKRYETKEELLNFSGSYFKGHPEMVFRAKELEAMHLLDCVSSKIIAAQEQRLQPFFEYMKAIRQYAAMEKGDAAYRSIDYTKHTFAGEFDLLAGVYFTDQEGKKLVGWGDQEVMYTDQATALLVRLRTSQGRKIFQIPLNVSRINNVLITDDVKAVNRNEWYKKLNDQSHKWEKYGERKEIPNIPVPHSVQWKDSFENNKNMMEQQGFFAEKYCLPNRPKETFTDLYYHKEGPKLHSDDTVISIFYKASAELKIVVDYLKNVHLFTLTQNGIFYLKDKRLYFRNVHNQVKMYEQSFSDTTRLFASGKYIFIEQVIGYQNTGREVDTFGGYGLDTYFKVIYCTIVIESGTGRQVAVWRDLDEMKSVKQYNEDIVVVETVSQSYQLYETEQSMKSMEDWGQRSKMQIH